MEERAHPLQSLIHQVAEPLPDEAAIVVEVFIGIQDVVAGKVGDHDRSRPWRIANSRSNPLRFLFLLKC